MQKSPLIGINIAVTCLIILASYTTVVGFQTVESSKHIKVKDEINQKELLFQTILDIANNKEIQKIIQNSEIKKGFEISIQVPGAKSLLMIPRIQYSMLLRPPPVLTNSFLEHAYNIGVRLSKTFDSSRIHSILEQYQGSNQRMQKEIFAIIEKNDELNKKIEQLSSVQCNCENNNTTRWGFPVLCTLLLPLVWLSAVLYFINHNFILFLSIMFLIGETLNCYWIK